jgi:post-segregation antitoxin (ccd killing protein)
MKVTGTLTFNLQPLGPFKFVSKPYVLAFAPVEIPEAQRKLVAWWKFDETEGKEISDSSGNKFIGTLIGNPQWQPTGGKTGGALEFDGDGDYIECGRDEGLNISGAVTIAAWIKLSKSTTDQKIAGNQDNITGGYKLSIFSDKAELEVRDSGNLLRNNRFVDGGTILQPGVWYHIAGTYGQGGSIKTYVNAKLDREQETLTILAPSTGPLKIGCEPFSGECLFNGLMDDLRIYNYPLSQTEITALYSGETLPTTAQAQVPATAEEEPGTIGKWIPALVIVIVAVAAAALAIRSKKTTA